MVGYTEAQLAAVFSFCYTPENFQKHVCFKHLQFDTFSAQHVGSVSQPSNMWFSGTP